MKMNHVLKILVPSKILASLSAGTVSMMNPVANSESVRAGRGTERFEGVAADRTDVERYKKGSEIG